MSESEQKPIVMVGAEARFLAQVREAAGILSWSIITVHNAKNAPKAYEDTGRTRNKLIAAVIIGTDITVTSEIEAYVHDALKAGIPVIFGNRALQRQLEISAGRCSCTSLDLSCLCPVEEIVQALTRMGLGKKKKRAKR